jgi:hypothetical protein
MIFQHTWQQVLDGSKTQTRRLVKPGEIGVRKGNYIYEGDVLLHILTDDKTVPLEYVVANNRVKWQVGHTYAVQPGRGKTNLYHYSSYMLRWDSIHDTGLPELGSTIDQSKRVYGDNWRQKMTTYPNSWHEARIRLTAIRQERLRNISEADAKAEGIELPVNVQAAGALAGAIQFGFDIGLRRDAYAELWDSINTRKGTRWEDNPDVWVLEFELEGN